jgi:hypothetical protein
MGTYGYGHFVYDDGVIAFCCTGMVYPFRWEDSDVLLIPMHTYVRICKPRVKDGRLDGACAGT